jgi:glycosyltransferase 2 family protein
MSEGKRRLLTAVQFVVGVGIMAFILTRMHGRGEIGRLISAWQAAHSNWPLVLSALLTLGACIGCGVLRWRVILQAQGIPISIGRLSVLYLIGQVFNAFMLGATGGDLMKACYAAQETRHKRTECVISILVERAIGTVALVGLAVLVVLANANLYWEHRETRVAMAFVAVLLAGTIAGLAVVIRKDVFEQWAVFRRLEERTRLGAELAKAYDSARFCMSHGRVMGETLILSLLNHLGLVVAVFHLGLALELPLSYAQYLSVFLVINAVASLPITPCGLGTRESAAIFMLGVLGVHPASAVSLTLLLYGLIIVWSLIGGIVYLVNAVRHRDVTLAVRTEMEAHPSLWDAE